MSEKKKLLLKNMQKQRAYQIYRFPDKREKEP